MPKAFFIDTTRCTACRGCQIACKEWHELEANKTYQEGSHQNPPDLNPNNYKLVRFTEFKDDDGVVHWNFFPDQCRHCVVPPCKEVSDMALEGAILKDEETGAVIFTDKTRELSPDDAQAVREACPYDIPRRSDSSGLLSKCTMCIERVQNDLVPMCVKTCCTGTMNFGERADMMALAEKRLAEVRKTNPEAMLADPDFTSAIFLLGYSPDRYWEHAVSEAPAPMNRQQLFARLTSPVRKAVRG